MKYPFALVLITCFMMGCKKPEACFNISNEKPSYKVNENIKFISCSLVAKKYVWDFGDGQVQSKADAQISHKYAAPGNYTVTLKVINGSSKDTASKTIAVK